MDRRIAWVPRTDVNAGEAQKYHALHGSAAQAIDARIPGCDPPPDGLTAQDHAVTNRAKARSGRTPRHRAAPGGKALVTEATPARRRGPRPVVRHAAVAVTSVLLVGLFWSSRPTWDPEMRLWKAVGDAAFGLLFVTLAVGPLARLFRPASRLLPWRRQLGIWFALTATVHGVLVVHGWARWSLRRFLGYEVIPQLGREVRLEPGFGLANLIGLVALMFALLLAATSSDRAVRRLGSGWKWLHHSALFVFYLSLLHAGYFLFLHYTASFHKAVPPPDWFRAPFVFLGGALLALQAAAFVKRTSRRPQAVGS